MARPVAQRPGLAWATRQLDRCGIEHRLERLERARRRQAQLHRGAVGCDPVPEVVVHLHDEQRAALQRDADIGGQDVLAAAGRPGTHPRRVVEARTARAQSGAAETGPAVAAAPGTLGAGRRGRRRRHSEEDDVVHLRRLSGRDVEARDERVVGDLRVEDETAVVVGADRRRLGRVEDRRGHGPHRLACPKGCGLGRCDGPWCGVPGCSGPGGAVLGSARRRVAGRVPLAPGLRRLVGSAAPGDQQGERRQRGSHRGHAASSPHPVSVGTPTVGEPVVEPLAPAVALRSPRVPGSPGCAGHPGR